MAFPILRRKVIRRGKTFDPNREFVQSAMKDYLENGGKISKMKPNTQTLEGFLSMRNDGFDADDFLRGQ